MTSPSAEVLAALRAALSLLPPARWPADGSTGASDGTRGAFLGVLVTPVFRLFRIENESSLLRAIRRRFALVGSCSGVRSLVSSLALAATPTRRTPWLLPPALPGRRRERRAQGPPADRRGR